MTTVGTLMWMGEIPQNCIAKELQMVNACWKEEELVSSRDELFSLKWSVLEISRQNNDKCMYA